MWSQIVVIELAEPDDGGVGTAQGQPTCHGEAMEQHAPQSPEDVRAFFRDWIDSANAGQWDRFGQLMHPDIVIVDPMTPEPARGIDEALPRAQAQYEPFPDGRIHMVGAPFVSLDEPELAYRWRFVGTHLRPINPPGFAPTAQQVMVEGTSVLHFRDGRVDHLQLFFDTTDVARQLLAAPPAGSPLERVMALSQRVRVRLRRRAGR